jgi:hypothetical protein
MSLPTSSVPRAEFQEASWLQLKELLQPLNISKLLG